jgi:hypothetical protein
MMREMLAKALVEQRQAGMEAAAKIIEALDIDFPTAVLCATAIRTAAAELSSA